VRVALHPSDVTDSRMLEAWQALLTSLLADRVALTKSDAIAKATALAASATLVRA